MLLRGNVFVPPFKCTKSINAVSIDLVHRAGRCISENEGERSC